MRSVAVILICWIFGACSNKAYLFTSFHEPADTGLRMLYSYNGKDWTDFDTVFLQPKIGKQKVLRDPSMTQGKDGVFYLVWTTSWRGDNGFGYSSSKDLLHWTEQRFLPVMQKEPNTVNVWAPEIFYDEDSSRFILIWASTVPGRFERGIESDSNNHRMYVTTTKDFETFTPTQLFFDPKFSVIDAVIVKRKKDDYVLVLKDNTRNELDLKVAFSDSPLGPWNNVSKAFTEKYSEGPSIVKLKDQWLIYFDSYNKKKYEASSTRDFVNFENVTTEITVPTGHKHGTIVPVSKSFLKKMIKEVMH